MRTMINKQSVLFILLVVVLCVSASAQCEPKSLLTVSGTGELQIKPDQATFVIEVQNFDKDRTKAKTDNSGRVRNVLEVIHSFKVEDKSIQTQEQSVEARYKRNDESKALIGFNAVTRIRVKLLDLNALDGMQEKVLAQGATEVSDIQFDISDRPKHRAQARALAIAAAKEKAQAMAQELGQKIGRAFSLTETSNEQAWLGGSVNANISAYNAEKPPVLAEGTIKIQESVRIEFELQ
jgi:uncharacterized protein YggE